MRVEPAEDVVVGVVAVLVVAGELELEVEVELEVDDGAWVVLGDVVACVVEVDVVVGVLVVSGSTYCWSPAEVPVPEASAVALIGNPITARAAVQARIRSTRRTWPY